MVLMVERKQWEFFKNMVLMVQKTSQTHLIWRISPVFSSKDFSAYINQLLQDPIQQQWIFQTFSWCGFVISGPNTDFMIKSTSPASVGSGDAQFPQSSTRYERCFVVLPNRKSVNWDPWLTRWSEPTLWNPWDQKSDPAVLLSLKDSSWTWHTTWS